MTAMQESANVQGQPAKVSLQLRGAVGPTTGSKILTQSGLKGVTPQELLEPPLDTVVIDNKDKPNAPDAGGEAIAGLQEDLSNKLAEKSAIHEQNMQQQYQKEMSGVGFQK
jgi:hypothetical protein